MKRKIQSDITTKSAQGQLLLKEAFRKRKRESLIKLKELAVERQYLATSMKKYAGQYDTTVNCANTTITQITWLSDLLICALTWCYLVLKCFISQNRITTKENRDFIDTEALL